MSPAEHDRYRAAVEPWARKAARERRVVSHVRYLDGQADVTITSKTNTMEDYMAEIDEGKPVSRSGLLL